MLNEHLVKDHLISPKAGSLLSSLLSSPSKQIVILPKKQMSMSDAVTESIARRLTDTSLPIKIRYKIGANNPESYPKEYIFKPDLPLKNRNLFHTNYQRQLFRMTVEKVKLWVRQLHSIDPDFLDFNREKLVLTNNVKACICIFCRTDKFDISLHTDLVVANEPFSCVKITHEKSVQTGVETSCCVANISASHTLHV